MRLLVISSVLPFPRKSGQQQRVYHKLQALREHFHLTFLAPIDARMMSEARSKLLELCDDVLLLPSEYGRSVVSRCRHRLLGTIFSLRTGLKLSNYVVSRVDLAPSRVGEALDPASFDSVLFEYWHAADSTSVFRERGIPCVLDMHDILWQSYARQLEALPVVPDWWKRRALSQYRTSEERAWGLFDAVIAINSAEREYAAARVPGGTEVLYCPMGTDLLQWPYSPEPAWPPRVAYYGGLGSPHNQHSARLCYEQIMPAIWAEHPDAELWLVGSDPPSSLRDLAKRDGRVKVPGYLPRVQDELRMMSVILCPWTGTYGFRSRLVEAMALGVPVVASPDAVYGMEMEGGRGILIEDGAAGMAGACLGLLAASDFAGEQGRLARTQVEEKFSYDATYGQLARSLLDFVPKAREKLAVTGGGVR